MSIASINPATGDTEQEFAELTDAELEQRLAKAAAAFGEWSRTPVADRAAVVGKAGDILERDAKQLAETATREMGKPVGQAEAEVKKSAGACRFYAEHGPAFIKPEVVETDFKKSYVRFDPLGPVLAVMPWNFPFWQVVRFAAPALVAGNVGLLKHAGNVPQCALALEAAFKEAGAPPGVFTTLLISARKVEDVITDDRVAAVTLTGSEPAGQAVATAAGKELKKTVLELGGSDPFIVLEDAPLEGAVTTAVTARVQNNGQSCIAAKRFIVVASQAEAFTKLLTERMSKLKVGDPLQAGTDVGPLARTDLRDELHEQVETSAKGGASVLTGGKIPDQPGAYYPPTVLTDVKPGTPAYEEELFGPVASVIVVPDENEAVRVANDTRFGLGASVWTGDRKRGERIAARIQSGFVAVNDMVKSDARLPFGGIKKSGYGRELSHFGLREFVNIKTVTVS